MLDESILSQFTGSEEWHRHLSGLLFTDGILYLAQNGGKGGAFWLIDAIASYQPDKRIRGNAMLRDFQLWELAVTGSTAVLSCRADSDRKPVISQVIEFTDFDRSIKLYVCGDTLLLPSEY